MPNVGQNKGTNSGSSTANSSSSSGPQPQAGATLSIPSKVQLHTPKSPKAPDASTAGNSFDEDLFSQSNEDVVRRSSRLKSANRTRKYGAIIYD